MNPFDKESPKLNFTSYLRSQVDQLEVGESKLISIDGKSQSAVSGSINQCIQGRKFSLKKGENMTMWAKRTA